MALFEIAIDAGVREFTGAAALQVIEEQPRYLWTVASTDTTIIGDYNGRLPTLSPSQKLIADQEAARQKAADDFGISVRRV